MKPDLDAALESIMRRLEAGETLEQCLAGLEPARAAELRPLVEVTRALAGLRMTPAPAALAAQRQKFLAQAAAYRHEQAQAQENTTLWQQMGAWLARPRWRDAVVAATLTLVLGLALLAGVLRGALWMHQAEVAPSATFVALAGDTATPAATAPMMTPAPQESPTPAPLPTATPLATETPAPVPALSQPTMSPSPTPIIATPTLPAATATPQPTQTPPPVVATVAPTATPAPPTPTPLPPLPTPTDRPERPTPQPTVAPPSATPTREPTVTPTRTKMPGPRMETTPLPTPPR